MSFHDIECKLEDAAKAYLTAHAASFDSLPIITGFELAVSGMETTGVSVVCGEAAPANVRGNWLGKLSIALFTDVDDPANTVAIHRRRTDTIRRLIMTDDFETDINAQNSGFTMHGWRVDAVKQYPYERYLVSAIDLTINCAGLDL
jgi:hypothetical protein